MSTKRIVPCSDSPAQANETSPAVTRREAIKKLAMAATAAALAPALSKAPKPEYIYAPKRPAPYPDPERTAIVDKWIARFDQPLIEFEKMWEFLNEARTKAPAEIDAEVLYNLLDSIQKATETLWDQIDEAGGETFFKAVTGQYSWCIYIERELNEPGCDFDLWQKEIPSLSKRHPADAARLQAILDARQGGAL